MTDTAPPAPPASGLFAHDLPEAIESLDADRIEALLAAWERASALNTVRAVRSDLKMWRAWCARSYRPPLPASPSDLVWHLRDAVEDGLRPATLSRRLASIARLHALAGLEDPTKDDLVRYEMRAIKRALGTAPRQKLGLRVKGDVEDLRRDAPVGLSVLGMIAAQPETILGLRNRALLSFGYDTGMRRSELVEASWENLERAPDGSAAYLLARSKTDQEGVGAWRYVSPRSVGHLAAWADAAGVEDGPIFRRVTRFGTIGAAAITGARYAMILKEMAAVAIAALPEGERPDDAETARILGRVSGHSTRIGVDQDLIAGGADLAGVMQALGWRSPQMPARYASQLAVRSGAAAKVLKGI